MRDVTCNPPFLDQMQLVIITQYVIVVIICVRHSSLKYCNWTLENVVVKYTYMCMRKHALQKLTDVHQSVFAVWE